MITIKRYRASYEKVWNTFVADSVNGTFILDRRYMDYHQDRFRDHSLLLYSKQTLIALLPGHENGKILVSHDGLTYGGLLVLPGTHLAETLACFYALMKYLNRHGFATLRYKPVPALWHREPFLHDFYALHILGSKIRDVSTCFVIDLTQPTRLSPRRTRQIKKARKAHVIIQKAKDCRKFWAEALVPRLASRFGVPPVHTIDEIELLASRFPKNILQYEAYVGKNLAAGVTLFLSHNVGHVQYMATTEIGRQTGSLDYLIWRLMTGEVKKIKTLSLGTTNSREVGGKVLNTGLARWKEEFGSSMVPFFQYEIRTKNYSALLSYETR